MPSITNELFLLAPKIERTESVSSEPVVDVPEAVEGGSPPRRGRSKKPDIPNEVILIFK